MRVEIKVDDGIISDIRFKTFGAGSYCHIKHGYGDGEG